MNPITLYFHLFLVIAETESFQVLQCNGNCIRGGADITLLTFSTYFDNFFQRPWKK